MLNLHAPNNHRQGIVDVRPRDVHSVHDTPQRVPNGEIPMPMVPIRIYNMLGVFSYNFISTFGRSLFYLFYFLFLSVGTYKM